MHENYSIKDKKYIRYICDICEKLFNKSNALQYHMNHVHDHRSHERTRESRYIRPWVRLQRTAPPWADTLRIVPFTYRTWNGIHASQCYNNEHRTGEPGKQKAANRRLSHDSAHCDSDEASFAPKCFSMRRWRVGSQTVCPSGRTRQCLLPCSST